MAWRSALEWLILFLILGFGIYTMRIIKNEKKIYLENAKERRFKLFTLFIPTWWGEVETNNDDEICFKRLDTRYDWQARFIWNEQGSKLDLIELFKEHIHSRQILFDEENSVIYNPTDFKDGPLISTGKFEMVRLEGTATQDRQERLYYDAFLVREIATGAFLYAESRSSILNGLVEGPYFEEVMIRLALNS